MPLIEFTDKGLFCPPGNFYIDPWKPVENAIISHAHSDHAKWGSKNYLCHPKSKPVLQLRLGDNNYQTAEWNQTVLMNGVKISLHPAGHIIGSSQVRVEYNGEVWVFSGDYKTENDGLSGAFEPVQCHTFITESTFGLPIYNWQPQAAIYADMQNWVVQNMEANKASVIIAYSLGKAQRVLQAVSAVTNNIFVHGAVWNTQQALQEAGENLPQVKRVTPETNKADFKNAVIIAPPGADGSPWLKKFTPYRLAICSGWMQVRGNARRRNVDKGFVLSDHADWNGLLTAVKATNAQKVFVTHGFQAAFSKYLTENGIEAAEVKTAYGNEEENEKITTEEL
jgi:putative mRNA 3-end processing factor